jgi:hypothetical protein
MDTKPEKENNKDLEGISPAILALIGSAPMPTKEQIEADDRLAYLLSK